MSDSRPASLDAAAAEAIEALRGVLADPEASAASRVAAAIALLDRAFGRPAPARAQVPDRAAADGEAESFTIRIAAHGKGL